MNKFRNQLVILACDTLTVGLSVISNACNFAVVSRLPVTMGTYGCDWVQ